MTSAVGDVLGRVQNFDGERPHSIDSLLSLLVLVIAAIGLSAVGWFRWLDGWVAKNKQRTLKTYALDRAILLFFYVGRKQ